MSTDADVRQARTVPHIPLEVLRIIAKQLGHDVASARSLARTCRSLRDAGEIGCWTMLDLTSRWSPNGRRPTRYAISALQYQDRARTVILKVQHALKGIKSYPFRLQCITAIRIEPFNGPFGGGYAQTVIDLLRRVAPTLQSLAVTPLPQGSADSEDFFGQYHFYRLLEAEKIDFPRLTHLQYAVQPLVSGGIDTWMTRMVNLTSLEVCSATGTFDGLRPTKASKLTPYPRLETVTLHNVARDSSANPMLALILAVSPNLSMLRLRGSWAPKRYDENVQTMRGMASLKALLVLSEKGTVEVTRDFGRVKLAVREMVTEELHLKEDHELRLEVGCNQKTNANAKCDIPAVAPLQRFTILTSPRMPLAEYAALSVGSREERMFKPGVQTLREIGAAPSLTSILFLDLATPCSSTYTSGFVEPEYFVPPERWESEGHRGVVIRQYGVSGRGQETFIHIRCLSRVERRDGGRWYVGPRRRWNDFTYFQGHRIPRNVLEDVYKEAGDDIAFVQGGRGLSMTDSAWQILRDWRATRGPDDEAEQSDSDNSDGGVDWDEDDFDDSDSDDTDDDDGDQGDAAPGAVPGAHDGNDQGDSGDEGGEDEEDGGSEEEEISDEEEEEEDPYLRLEDDAGSSHEDYSW